MAKFIISYDLHKVRDYSKIIATLKAWGAVKALESTWLLSINSTAMAIRDSLKLQVDADDSMVVIELKEGSNWTTWNANAAAVWLKANIAA